jgi:hypothetical protein
MKIKHRITGKTLFECEAETTKEALVKAIDVGAYLGGADLRGANLRWADLRGTNLRWADLRGANIRGADLRGAYLGGANLRWADLGGADLSGADLGGADLRGANLRGANLRGANLGGADLSGVNIRGAKIRNEIELQKIPIQIYTAEYNIMILDNHMQIGCEFHSLVDWWSFDDKRITVMGGKTALKWWRKWQVPLMAICAANDRGGSDGVRNMRQEQLCQVDA